MPSKKTKETAVAEEIKEAVVQQDTVPESKTARKNSSSRKTTSKRVPKTKAVAETVKTEEIKTDAEVKVEEPAAEVVTAEAPAVQEIAAEEPVKKEAAPKAAAQKKRVRNSKKVSEPKKRVRKPAAAPAPVVNKNSLTLQINGRNYTEERFLREAKDVWVYDMGMKADEFINVELIVKPDEAVVTGMVNGKTEIRFSI